MGTDQEALKRAVAQEALRSVENGMLLGLGTGSTAAHFVRQLGSALKDGTLRDVRGVCTSNATAALARECGIEIVDLPDDGQIDLAVDGADEIDSDLRLIKGLGGALLREKIVEQAASRFIVMADESKLVEKLGRGLLPIEVVVFASERLLDLFRRMGLQPQARTSGTSWLVTDEGHRIIDVKVPGTHDVEDVVDEVTAYAGVVETGYFPFEATEALIASPSGVKRLTRD